MHKQKMGSTTILAKRHLLTDMWRHASAEGLSVDSFLKSIPHYPVAEATSDFHTHGSTKYPSFHTINAVRIFHLALGAACLHLCSVNDIMSWVCF